MIFDIWEDVSQHVTSTECDSKVYCTSKYHRHTHTARRRCMQNQYILHAPRLGDMIRRQIVEYIY